jgi:acyl carrier protein
VTDLGHDDVATRIEGFVRAQFDVDPDDPGFGRAADLFGLGYIDSVGVAELLEFLREEFGVELPESELLGDDFSTIDGIAGIVCRLTGPGRGRLPEWMEEVMSPGERR